MQLIEITLSGFKSFVDTTKVPLRDMMVGVVGPNGCGKSNIIDAIQWVMGESSAKQLRGELMTDVIFNGSSSRKPVGQASVELTFDNSDHTLGGELSGYAEISIRRVITRNADSTYYLNNQRCRRRDIMDIFLGTGLGPRSYSIIGQNMISRLIEAKPDDMRVYFEEAAGISKYKERRRETENRIQHTKENLSRLSDLRAELEKQLGTLKRQSSAAERFKILKQEERSFRSQWYATQWRQLDTRLVQYSLQIQQQETGVEARHAELSQIDLQLETKREDQHSATEAFQEVQRRYYAAGNDISRMEQEIRYHQERQHQWQTDLDQVEKDWQVALEQMEEMEDQSRELTEEMLQLEPEGIAAKSEMEAAIQDVKAAEETNGMWQTTWDDFNQFMAKTTQAAQVEQTRIQHLDQKLAGIKQRQAKLTLEEEQFQFSDLEQEIAALADVIQEAVLQNEEYQTELEAKRDELNQLQQNERLTISEMDRARHELQQLRGQEASLQAMQETALGQRNNSLSDWLSERAWGQHPRLAQSVEVTTGWETAVEKVLGANLQAICVDDIASIASEVATLPAGNLQVFATTAARNSGSHAAHALINKVKSDWSLEGLLAGVYTADSLEEAITLSKQLAPHESVITADGVWLSASWLKLSRDTDPAAGVFQREQELKQLAQRIQEKAEQLESLEETLEDTRAQIQSLAEVRDALQKTANQAHAKASELQAQDKVKSSRLNDIKQRAAVVRDEIEECVMAAEEAQTELQTARSSWQHAMQDLEQQADRREGLIQERDAVRARLQDARERLNLAKDVSSQIQIRTQTSQSQEASLKQTMMRMQTQMNSLAKRKTALEDELKNAASVDELEQTLGTALEQRLSIENELNLTRSVVETLEQEMRYAESRRQEIDRELVKLRDVLETLRIDSQSFKVKAENLVEQLKEIGMQLEEVLQTIPEDADADDLHSQLEQTNQRIVRLGPINLVAIEEYATCSERKEYLDRQDADLQDGLNTLESAIAKIDKETRARFKEVFDKVNTRFQELFPTVFAGGRAYLELTGENLLDAGVTVMACPPGKRNSTIHLLSGGEKALTAIALVFSIFHLNPAPFCLLDEVDAPLDDANIGRFCKLVQAMSDKTQFIFISHNKLAIEMARHLIGVTMHEPGVSRLVSVNVEEAVSLAGA